MSDKPVVVLKPRSLGPTTIADLRACTCAHVSGEFWRDQNGWRHEPSCNARRDEPLEAHSE